MIIRKPYAFLIKHFRKIHIALMVLGIYIFLKTIDTARFVNDFMNYGVYDFYADPITKHITFLFQMSILIMIILNISLVLLLKHKQKPWKTYLFPTILYIVLFFTLSMIKSFFRTYTEMVDTTNLRLSRDLLMIFMFAELPAIAIFLGRVFGIDLKKFHFNLDLKQLELTEEDREEIEIGLKVDKYTFIRWGRKILRHLGYFYEEHNLFSKIVITCLCFFLVVKSYNNFVNNRVYHQGELYNVNGYSIKVNNSYYTDKDNIGNVISKESNFVITELEIKNYKESRNIDLSKFHLKSGTKDYTSTDTTYANEFEDLGTSYSKVRNIKQNETVKFIIIYKVDKNIKKNKFVLYYQEDNGIYKLRKIKLNVKDLREMEKVKKLSLGDSIEIPIKGKEDTVSFDEFEINNQVTYKVNKCTTRDCNQEQKTFTAKEGSRILSISFSSDLYEAKNVIDFLDKYGKINYKDNEDNNRSIDVDIAIKENYFGKIVYIEIPIDAAFSNTLSLDITIRNKKYNYKLS